MENEVHTVPTKTIEDHMPTAECWCEPVIEFCADGVVIIHTEYTEH